MVLTSDQPRRRLPPNVPPDANVQAEIARLTKLPGWDLLRAAVSDARGRWAERFALGMLSGGHAAAPADQREIDYKRGYWDGALWAIEKLPNLTSAAYDRFVEEALKEAESRAE